MAKSSRPAKTAKNKRSGIDATVPDGQPDPGLIITSDTSAGTDDFVAALATHRHFARETDPPRV